MNNIKIIGNTPMIKINYEFKNNKKYIYAKLEYYNLTGSIKDRVALYMIKNAKKRGILKDDMPIIEATSGNTGISLSAIGKAYGHKVYIFMPDWVSIERRKLIKAYGAEVILYSKEEGGFLRCIEEAKKLAIAKDGYLTNQFSNKDNFLPGIMIMLTVLCLNIVSEGITDAIAAPKSAVKVDENDLNKDREADRMVADPTLAYAAQADMLNKRLAALKEAELTRTDRFEARTDVPPILEVKDLCIKFPRHGDVNVVDHVSFVVRPRQTMGLVGESGCGKSITSLAIMGLLDKKAEISGEIMYDGKNLLNLSDKEMNELRGREIAMVYQDALSSLNPSMLIRSQMKQLTKRGGTRTAEELLELVGLDPKRTLDSYPHELSGGQRQRVLIAMALTRDPKLVIADEPTTALDVTVQKQVIDLLNKLQHELGFAMVFVSHDLALVAEVANSITVMYAGQVVEQGPVKEILTNPIHEYTRGLLGSVLSIEAGGARLHHVPGSVPSPKDFPEGDRFRPRSSHPDKTSNVRPMLKRVANSDHYYAELPDSELKRIGVKPYLTGGAN